MSKNPKKWRNKPTTRLRAQHIPEGVCPVCWVRWGRAFKAEQTKDCRKQAGACVGLSKVNT